MIQSIESRNDENVMRDSILRLAPAPVDLLALFPMVIEATRAPEPGPRRPNRWAVSFTWLPPAGRRAGKGQYRTISEAAKAVEPGDTVIIHDGVYREVSSS